MSRKSVTAVSKMLVEFGAASESFTARDVVKTEKLPMAPGFIMGNETYGKDSHLYVDCPDMDTRHRLEDFLEERGATVRRTYWKSAPVVDVVVSYFKGWHHDE